MPARPSFWIDTEGPDAEAVRLGFQWLLEAMERAPSHPATGLLITSLKGTLSNSVPMAALGERYASALVNGRGIEVKGGTIRHGFLRDLPYDVNGPVLALWADQKMLDKIDDIYGITEVLITPSLRREVLQWVSTWRAEELTGKGRGELPKLHPVLIQALATLDGTANKGMLHPMDEARAVEVFKVLRKARVPFDGDGVRAWLMGTHEWPPRSADWVAKAAAAIGEGKRVRGGSYPTLADDILSQWRTRAVDRQG